MENIQTYSESFKSKSYKGKNLLPTETWTHLENDLWLGPNGVIVNQSALEERKFYYTIVLVK